MSLSKTKLRVDPLNGRIVMYQHGKNHLVALDKRDAETEVMAVVVGKMASNSGTMTINLGGAKYVLQCRPSNAKAIIKNKKITEASQ